MHSLVWGGVSLDEGAVRYIVPGCKIRVLSGTSFGAARSVVEFVRDLLDGSRAVRTGDDNREPSLRIELTADSDALLASGHAAIDRLVGSPSTLSWTLPDRTAPASVFEVEDSIKEHLFDDFDATIHRSVIQVTFNCRPFVRTASRTVVPAVLSTTSAVVDTCDSTTGWTPEHGTVAVVSGQINHARLQVGWSSLVRAGAIDMSVTKYLQVEWTADYGLIFGAGYVDNGQGMAEVRREDMGSGWFRSTFEAPRSIPASGFRLSEVSPDSPGTTATLSVRHVARTTTIGQGTTLRAKVSSLPPAGTVRSKASFHIASPDANGLGDTLLLTAPSSQGFLPPYSPWFSTGSRTTDASTVSGYRFDIAAAINFFVAPATLFEEGKSSLVVARMRTTGTLTRTLNIGTETWMNGAVVGTSYNVTAMPFIFTTVNVWEWKPIDIFPTPPNRVGPNGKVTIGLQGEAGLQLDEILVLPVTPDTSLSWIKAGAFKHVWIDEPADGLPASVWVGNNADRSDAFSADSNVVTRDDTGHVVHPGGTTVTAVTTGVLDARTEANFYPRFRDLVPPA